MPRSRSILFCPICKSQGGFLTKRQVKRAIYLPKFHEIKTVSQAWDYAAKVCLRMHKVVIRLPLDDKETDEMLSNGLYKDFAELLGNLHSKDQIELFESRQFERLLKLKNITKVKRKDNLINEDNGIRENEEANIAKNSGWKDPYEETMHFPLPDNTGTITKLSISWLYAVIVCKTLCDFLQEFPYSQDKFYINGIYTAFRLLSPSSDLRSRRDSLGWIKIYEDVKNHGYNAASSLNAVILDSQDKSKKKDAVKLSVKHIRNHQQKTEQLLIDIINYMPSFIELVENIIHIINNAISTQDREEILKNFDINEEMLNEGEFDRYDYYFIKHYDSSKKSRIRWCPISLRNLTYVNLMDYRYYHYKEMIKRYTDNNIDNSDSISVKYQKLQLFASACNILKELGFKTSHIQDKIKSNIYACYSS